MPICETGSCQPNRDWRSKWCFSFDQFMQFDWKAISVLNYLHQEISVVDQRIENAWNANWSTADSTVTQKRSPHCLVCPPHSFTSDIHAVSTWKPNSSMNDQYDDRLQFSIECNNQLMLLMPPGSPSHIFNKLQFDKFSKERPPQTRASFSIFTLNWTNEL